MLDRDREGGAKGRRQKLGVPWPTGVDRPHGVDDVARREREAWGDARFAGRASYTGSDLGNLTTGFEELGTRGSMDRTIDPASAKHLLIGGVDDDVDGLARQVALEDFDASSHR